MRSTHTPNPIFFGLVMLSLVGCSDRLAAPLGEDRPLPAQPGGQLTVATFVTVRSVDPAVAFDEAAEPILRLLFARLLRLTPDGQFAPELAESYQLAPDGLSVRVRLRPGSRFHDGSELTAHDVKRSLERSLHPDTPCPAPSFFDRLVGYEAYRDKKTPGLTGIHVESDYVVRFDLREPDATFIAALALPFAAPVCPSAGHLYDASFSQHTCGAGPFRLAQWQGQEALVLKRHDGYFGPLPHLEQVTWLFAVPPSTQRFRFERGQLDFVHELSASDSVAFRTDPRWQPFGAWNQPRSTRGIFMNVHLPPFDKLEVRQAVAHAIDRQAVAALRAGHLVAATTMVPPGVVGHDPDLRGQRYDYAQALEWMRRAGYGYDPATDAGGYPQPIDYVVTADSFDQQVAELFQQQLARIGLRIRIKALTWGAALAQTGRRNQVAIGADGWTADFDDPSDFYDPLFSSKAIQDEDSQNRAFFSSSELDALLEQARRELSPQERRGLYARANDIIRDQAPWAIAYGYRYYDVWQPYVHGYRPHRFASQELGFVWLDMEQKRRALGLRSAPPTSLSALAFSLTRRGGQP